jgi:hypothetical protein
MADQDDTLEQEIDDHVDHLRKTWEVALKNWIDTDVYHQLNFPVWGGSNARAHALSRGEFRPGTAHNIINHAADQNLAHVPVVKRDSIDPDSDRAKEAANHVEIGVKNILIDAAKRAMSPTFKQLFKHLISYGYGPVELSLDFSGGNEQRKVPGHWNPVRIEAIHPGRVLIDPLEKIPRSAIVIKKYTIQDLQILMDQNKRLKHFNPLKVAGRKKFDEIEVLIDWDMKRQVLKEVDGPILYSKPNSWGFVPFAHGFGGRGMEPTKMDNNDPSFLAEGILDFIKDTLRLQAQTMTGEQTMFMDYIYGPYGTTQDPAKLVASLETGNVLQGDKEDYWKLGIDTVPAGLFEHGRRLEADIERSTMSPGLMGSRSPGITTMGEAALQNDIQMRMFSAPSQQEEYLISIIASWILQLVARLPQLKGGIGARGHVLKKADIGRFFHVDVTFPVLNMAMQMQLREMALREVEMGGLSWLSYWEDYALIEDTSREETRLLQQRVKNHPSILARDAAATAEAMDDIDGEDVAAIRGDAEEGNLPAIRPPEGPQNARPIRDNINNNIFKPARIDS